MDRYRYRWIYTHPMVTTKKKTAKNKEKKPTNKNSKPKGKRSREERKRRTTKAAKKQ